MGGAVAASAAGAGVRAATIAGAGGKLAIAGSGGAGLSAGAGAGAGGHALVAGAGGVRSPANAGARSESNAGRASSAGESAPRDVCPPRSLEPGEHSFKLASANGVDYAYSVVVPRTYDARKPSALVVNWHALSSNPAETRALTHIDQAGEEANVVMVYPQSPDKSWDVGTCCTEIESGKRRDEVVFVRELLADVQLKVCIDPKRIYASGFSNGAMLSHMLACKLSDVFAAVVPMSGTLTIPEADCNPTRPIPILMINGTADPLVGYDASSLSGGLPVTDTFAFWAHKNQCSGSPEQTFSHGAANCQTYKHCKAGAEVTLCTIKGMGHCLAGMKVESSSNCLTKVAFGLIPIQLGPPNDDVDDIDMSFHFFERWTLP